MSDVLHRERLTPTHSGIVNQRAGFLARINAQAAALKPKPIAIPIVAVEPQPVPTQRRMTAAELEEKIAYFSQELNELRRVKGMLARQEFAVANGHPRIKEIQRAVCAFYGITMLDIQSHRRYMSVVLPRQIAMYLAKTMTTHGSPSIARKFGDRDHSTVLHAVEKIAGLLATDPKIALEIETIKASIVSLRSACSQPVEGTPCNSTPIPNLS